MTLLQEIQFTAETQRTPKKFKFKSIKLVLKCLNLIESNIKIFAPFVTLR